MATTIDDFDDLVTANEAASETSGKYFAIDVPDYEDTVKSASSDKRSYLRLGAADPDWTGEPGADLIALAYLAGATGRESADSGGYAPLAEAPNVVTALSATLPGLTPGDVGDMFIDDQRKRGAGNERADGAPGHGFTEEERRAISARLHTDVGWRDHTDGNRISTTRGDKVEVVYGNYKLVVLGRQTNPDFAQGWEACGDQIQDWADGTMPGASVTVEWVPDTTYGRGNEGDTADDVARGAWLLQNSTERVYQYARNAGNFREQNWGDLLETYTGSENPESIGTTDDAGLQGHPTHRDEALGNTVSLAPAVSSKGLPRGNPTIIERTWATRIDSQTGSAKLRVPTITATTHADRYDDTLNADHVHENVNAHTVVTNIGARAVTSYTHAAFILEANFAALTIDLFVGGRLLVEAVAAAHLTVGGLLEVTFGGFAEIHDLKWEASLTSTELEGMKTTIAATRKQVIRQEDRINVSKVNIAANSILLNKVKTNVIDNFTELNKVKTKVGDTEVSLCKLTLLN